MSSRDFESTRLEARARVLSALGDPIRLRILDELSGCERCACDIQESLGIAPNLLSYHLRILREAGLVVGTRRGRWIDYILAPDAASVVSAALPDSVAAAVAT